MLATVQEHLLGPEIEAISPGPAGVKEPAVKLQREYDVTKKKERQTG